MCLLGHVLLAAALLDQLDDMKAAGAAYRIGDVTDLHIFQGFNEQGRHLAQVAPADVAAFQGGGAV